MVHRTDPPGKPGPGDVRPLFPDDDTDPRLTAFAAWIRANDRGDIAAMTRAARELRGLGVSVCLAAGGRR
jgi:hypothetical protein